MLELSTAQEIPSSQYEDFSDSEISEINELLEDEQPSPSDASSCSGMSSSQEEGSRRKIKRRLWSAAEDRMLRLTVQHVMERTKGRQTRLPWLEIAKLVEGRTAKQCRDRWGSIDNSCTRSWTAEEDEKLMNLYAHYKNRWVKIAAHFKDRNDNMIKSRFRALRKNNKLQVQEKPEVSSAGTYVPLYSNKRARPDTCTKELETQAEKRVLSYSPAPDMVVPLQIAATVEQLRPAMYPIIKGTEPTCDGYDALAPRQLLPQQPEKGQVVAENENDWINFLVENVMPKPQSLHI
jgi:hypothetical protein